MVNIIGHPVGASSGVVRSAIPCRGKCV
jgi:hypothetical protein